VYFPEEIVSSFTPKSGYVIDPFGGTGSTLIACQKLKRKCFMMELDPAYCDVIVQRFKDLFPDEPAYLNNEEVSYAE
jgi:DNA modification methylase